MMKGYVWSDNKYTPEEEADGAYWERNMLALSYAMRANELLLLIFYKMGMKRIPPECMNGWYNDDDNNWDGWHRVISLNGGEITFHIPDNFEVGKLPQIKPNWNGHTTIQKWNSIAKTAGVELEWK